MRTDTSFQAIFHQSKNSFYGTHDSHFIDQLPDEYCPKSTGFKIIIFLTQALAFVIWQTPLLMAALSVTKACTLTILSLRNEPFCKCNQPHRFLPNIITYNVMRVSRSNKICHRLFTSTYQNWRHWSMYFEVFDFDWHGGNFITMPYLHQLENESHARSGLEWYHTSANI